MSKDPWRIVISYPPDKEEPVCEIYYKNKGWVQINYEDHGSFFVCFCNTDEGGYWEIPYDEAMEVLQEAKEHLKKMQRTPEGQAEYDAMKKEQEKWKPTPEETSEYERKMEEQRKKYYG